MDGSDTVINSAMFINWYVLTSAMALLTIFAFVSLAKAQKTLKNKRVNDAKFFVESGFEQIFKLVLASDEGNTALGCSVGIWKHQLKSILQATSFENLMLDSADLECEMKGSARVGSIDDLGIALTGFRQIKQSLRALYKEVDEVDYNTSLNEVRKSFLEWRDDMRERERVFSDSKNKVTSLRLIEGDVQEKERLA